MTRHDGTNATLTMTATVTVTVVVLRVVVRVVWRVVVATPNRFVSHHDSSQQRTISFRGSC